MWVKIEASPTEEYIIWLQDVVVKRNKATITIETAQGGWIRTVVCNSEDTAKAEMFNINKRLGSSP